MQALRHARHGSRMTSPPQEHCPAAGTAHGEAGRANGSPRAAALAASALAALVLAFPGGASAASAEWTGAADSEWATPANWTATPPPGSGDTATFATANGGHATVSLGAGVTVHDVAFQSTTTNFTIGAGAVGSQTLTLNHGGSIALEYVLPNPQRNATVNANVVLGTDAGAASYTLRNSDEWAWLKVAGSISGGTGGADGTKTLELNSLHYLTTIDGAIGGGGGTLAVTTDGYVILNGTNTFTGRLTMNWGTVYVPVVNNAGAPGPLGNSATPVTLHGGDLYYMGGSASSTKQFTLNNYGQMTFAYADTTLTLNGVIDGDGSLYKSGAGTLTLTAANTYAGGTGVNQGTLRLSGAGKLGDAGGFLVLGGAGATLDLGGTSQTVTGLYGSGGTIVNDGAGTQILTVNTTGRNDHFYGVIADNDNAGAGKIALTVSGTGVQYLAGANTYSGATSITGGLLVVEGSGSLGNTTLGTTVSSGATLALSGAAVGAEGITISGIGAAGCNGALTGADSICAGLLQLGADSTVSADSGAFDLTSTGTITGATRKLTLTGAGNGSLACIIGTTSGTVTKTGAGTWTLSGANTFTGALTVSAGTLAVPTINNASSAGPLGNSATAVTLSSSTFAYTGATASSTKPFTLSTSGAFRIDNSAARLTLGGLIAGTNASLTKTGPGTLVLSAANTYSGGTVVNGGVLAFSGSGRPGATTGAVTLNGTGILDLGGTSQTVGGLIGESGTCVLNDGTGTSTLTINTASSLDFHGSVMDHDAAGTTGIVALTKSGTGTLALSGTNSYSGATLVSTGVFVVNNSSGLGNDTGSTTVSSGAQLQFSGVNINSESITISGTGISGTGALRSTSDGTIYAGLLHLAASSSIQSDKGMFFLNNTGTITGAGFSLTLSGAGNGLIAGIIGTTSGAVTISGSGKWRLSGANTFAGALTVTGGGTLEVSTVNNSNTDGPLGHSATAVTLNNGTLEYTGGSATSTKPIALSTLGTIQIDNAANELTLSGLISGNGSLAKTGPGTLTLTAANSYGSGATTGTDIGAGTLKLSGSGKLGSTTTRLSLTGGTLDLGGTSQTVADFYGTGGTILNNGGGTSTLTVSVADSPRSFYGVIIDNSNGTAGIVALTNAGGGTLTLYGANTYSGATTISANAVIMLQDSGTLGNTVGGTTVAGTGTLVLYNCTCAEQVTISGAGTVAGYNAALSGYNSTLSGPLKLAAASTISTRYYGGPVGWFNITNPGTITGSGYALTLRNGQSIEQGTLASIIGTGAGTLTKTGPGMWILTAANTYTGATSITEGILNIQNSNALGGTAGGTTVTSGATLQIQGNISVGTEALSLAGTGVSGYATGALENVSGINNYGGLVTLGADSTIASDTGVFGLTNLGTITGAGYDLTLTGAGDGSIASIIGITSGTLTKTGAGTWSLTGLNTYTGKTFVQGGTLEIKVLKNVGSGSSYYSSLGAPTTVANGTIDLGSATAAGTLRFTGTADASSNRVINLAGTTGGATLDSSSASNNKLVLTSALTATGLGNKTLTLTGTGTGANEISAAIPNSAGYKTSVAKTGAGNWTLSGVNTYTGSTSVTAGTLILTQRSLADAADVNLTTGATLNLAFAGTDTINQLRIDGVVQSAGTWGSPTSAATYKTSLISGTGTLTVAGGATQQPYASWMAGYGITGADSAPGADPDHDGAINLAEYAYKGVPNDPTRSGLFALFVAHAAPPTAGELGLAVAVRKGAVFVSGAGGSQTGAVDGVSYTFAGSADLGAWSVNVRHVSGPSGTAPSGSGLSENLDAADWKYHVFGVDAAADPGGEGFLRAKVSGAP